MQVVIDHRDLPAQHERFLRPKAMIQPRRQAYPLPRFQYQRLASVNGTPLTIDANLNNAPGIIPVIGRSPRQLHT